MGRRSMFVILAVVMIIGLSFPGIGQSAAAPAPVPAKKLNIAVSQDPSSLDATFDSFGANGITIQNIYEFLIERDTNGQLIPGLASSWKISPDGKVYEFTLRKGVKFHSGDAFTVKDVLFTFERALKVNPRMSGKMRALDKIEALDEYRVRFLWKTPDVTILPGLVGTMIASKSYYDRVGEDKFVREPVGTGPYRVVRYEIGQYMDLERFEDYWGKKPSVREARIYFVSEDTTRMAKLQTGEVDLIQGVPFTMVKMVSSSPNFKVVPLNTNDPRAINFSTRNPNKPWHDKRVRQALAYAIDADSINKNVLMGITNNWGWLAPGDVGYDPKVKLYPYDPKRAKQLLAEAGYSKGFEMTIYWQMGGRIPMSGEVVQAVASYFEAVGVRTKLVGQELATFNITRREANKPTSDFVSFIAGGLAGSVDPTNAATSYLSCEGPSSVYCNPEFDKILFVARETVDDTKRGELVKELVKILNEEMPSIPIFNSVANYGMKKNVYYVPIQKEALDVVKIKNITVK